MQALTGRKVDLAFRVYQALLAAAAGSFETQPMDTHTQVSTLSLTTWTHHRYAVHDVYRAICYIVCHSVYHLCSLLFVRSLMTLFVVCQVVWYTFLYVVAHDDYLPLHIAGIW